MSVFGHCLCKSVRFALEGPTNWVGHCHCDSCRRATASPVTTFIGHPDDRYSIEGEIKEYQSSPSVTRSFCPSCGSPIFYRTTDIPGEIHFYAALLDDPTPLQPTTHWHYNEALPWLHITDDAEKQGV
ncbi:MAG: GFA family protein [Paracoccaceae bacterium]|nr:GFA family protein [Paracoccaceae bacterium]MDG2258736.1 GFA family protein [Paracoccaceae bacterium]